MTHDRDIPPAAPDHLGDRARGPVTGSGAHRAAGDAADLALTFRATGPAFAAPRTDAQVDDATDPYEFHAQSWFDGPGGGVANLVDAARAGSWDPLVDPLPDTAPSLGLAAEDACCAPEEPVLSPTLEAISLRTPSRHRRELTTEGWARAALTATQPVDLEDWFRPADPTAAPTQPVDLAELMLAQDQEPYADHPSGPLPQAGEWPPSGEVPDSPAALATPQIADAYDVTLNGALGMVELGFRGGYWYAITDSSQRQVSVAEAMRRNPELCSQITQIVCWWMRQHPMSDRALDLATELSMAVSELSRS